MLTVKKLNIRKNSRKEGRVSTSESIPMPIIIKKIVTIKGDRMQTMNTLLLLSLKPSGNPVNIVPAALFNLPKLRLLNHVDSGFARKS